MLHTPDTISTLRHLLTACRTIAVVGLSPQWHRPSLFAAFILSSAMAAASATVLAACVIGTVLGVVNGVLVARLRLPAFLATHPELGLNLQSSTHVVDFEREPVDLALRLGGGRWANVHAEFLFPEWITPVASPALLKQHGRPAPDQMARLPLLGDPANRWKDWFEHFGGQLPARYVAQFDDTETLHQAAAQGVGVALARWTLAEPLVKAGRLVTLTKKRLQADFAHYLVYPERSLGHPGFRKVRAWLLEQAGVAVER